MTSTTLAIRSHRGAVRGLREAVMVEGPDALSFLQGQLSQDIERLAPNETGWTLLLQPQGKISAWCRVTRTDHESFVLDVDHGWAEVIVARLQRFKLRTDCTISVAPWQSLTIVGPAAADAEVEGAEFEVVGHWAGLPTRDVFGADLAVADNEIVPDDLLDALRIEAGVPQMGAELDDSTIPAAAGIVDQSVSFTKGCFTGQELVARIDSRGNNVPRRLVGIVMSNGEAAVGASIVAEDGADVGVVTSAAHSLSLDGGIALGYVKRGVEVGDRVTVGSDGAEVRSLPLVTG